MYEFMRLRDGPPDSDEEPCACAHDATQDSDDEHDSDSDPHAANPQNIAKERLMSSVEKSSGEMCEKCLGLLSENKIFEIKFKNNKK
jgi:hypothetical protein